jgi:hypothetical protein
MVSFDRHRDNSRTVPWKYSDFPRAKKIDFVAILDGRYKISIGIINIDVCGFGTILVLGFDSQANIKTLSNVLLKPGYDFSRR